jgi:hypothetical protein
MGPANGRPRLSAKLCMNFAYCGCRAWHSGRISGAGGCPDRSSRGCEETIVGEEALVADRWPALMISSTLAAYLDCGSDSTLQRRLKVLRQHGLPAKDDNLNGWLREEVDLALQRCRGLIAGDERSAMLEAARGGGATVGAR